MVLPWWPCDRSGAIGFEGDAGSPGQSKAGWGWPAPCCRPSLPPSSRSTRRCVHAAGRNSSPRNNSRSAIANETTAKFDDQRASRAVTYMLPERVARDLQRRCRAQHIGSASTPSSKPNSPACTREISRAFKSGRRNSRPGAKSGRRHEQRRFDHLIDAGC